MSELSDKIRSEFKKADDERDALMNTPEDIERWDNIVYGHDDREMQRDRKSTRLNSSHNNQSRMPSSA